MIGTFAVSGLLWNMMLSKLQMGKSEGTLLLSGMSKTGSKLSAEWDADAGENPSCIVCMRGMLEAVGMP